MLVLTDHSIQLYNTLYTSLIYIRLHMAFYTLHTLLEADLASQFSESKVVANTQCLEKLSSLYSCSENGEFVIQGIE